MAVVQGLKGQAQRIHVLTFSNQHSPLFFVHTDINSAVLSQSPELSDLMTLVTQKAPVKWLVVGIQLKIEISTLMGFQAQTSDQQLLYIKVIP